MGNLLPPSERFVSCLNTHSRFVIASHEKPDGDCICASLALASFLKRQGKEILLYNPGPFARREIRKYKELFARSVPSQWGGGSAALIVVDCAAKERVGLDDEFQEAEMLIIDHHRVEADARATHYINPQAPSATLLVQALIEQMGTLTKQEAYYILVGFLTDSGFFRHLEGAEAASSLEHVGRLLRHGHALRPLYHTLFGGRPLDEVRFVSEIVMKAQPFLNGRLVMAVRTKKMSRKYNIGYISGEYVNAQLQLVKGVEVSALLTELEPDVYDVSLRAMRALDVAAIAKKFDGGGHIAASGFRWRGTLEALQMHLIQQVGTMLP